MENLLNNSKSTNLSNIALKTNISSAFFNEYSDVIESYDSNLMKGLRTKLRSSEKIGTEIKESKDLIPYLNKGIKISNGYLLISNQKNGNDFVKFCISDAEIARLKAELETKPIKAEKAKETAEKAK